MGALYRLDFSSGKSYIGITTGSAKSRFSGHRKVVISGSQALVHRAWRKYGAPLLKVVAIVENKDLLETEKRAVSIFRTLSPHGYNLTPGGEISPMTIPEIAARAKANSIATRKGKPLSAAHKAAISFSCMGNKHTPEAKEKMRKAVNKPEARKKMAEARLKLRGQKRTAEQRLAMSKSHLGSKASAETRAKMSASKKGKVFSKEHKERISAALTASWEFRNNGIIKELT